jgi:CRP/FNR family transcriptional regulator, nitrogen fixation regulation protein
MVARFRLSHSAVVDVTGGYNRLFDFEQRKRLYRTGEQLFAEGDSAFFVYRVVHGVVRNSRSLADGGRFVDAFRLDGDLVGLDVEGVREFTADAITDVFVSIARLDTIFTRPAVNRDAAKELRTATSQELQRARRHAIMLAMKARQRVATFLLEMSERLAQPEILDLAMSRQDIADYVGLTMETVSRVLTDFDRLYLIGIGSQTPRHIALLDPTALRRIAR